MDPEYHRQSNALALATAFARKQRGAGRLGGKHRRGLVGDDAAYHLRPSCCLIGLSISGVGDTRPYVCKRVYDPVIQSLSGFADVHNTGQRENQWCVKVCRAKRL